MELREISSKVQNFWQKLSLGQKAGVYALALALLVIGIYIVNPAKKLLEMRNSQRRTDISVILNAVYQYSQDNDKKLPEGIGETPTFICRTAAKDCQGMIDLSQVTTNKKYALENLPVDPKEKNPLSTGYQISRLASGRINVTAPEAENKAIISLSK